jgi:hypothetical protein
MKTKILTLFGLALILAACSTVKETRPVQWRPLLGSDATNNWRTFRATGFPQRGWTLEDGVLHLSPGGKGGDLISVQTFDNFEFAWEWKVAPKANNGIKYLVTESRPNAPGHEYQMVDDATMRNLKHKTATFYDVLPVQIPAKSNPPGEWNQSRLVIQGNYIEHWLNGVRVLEYELGSDAVKAALAQSKFKNAPGFGDKIKGHLLLTNHKDEAWYRNLRIRELPAK